MNKTNILYIICDQLRYDCIQALGNSQIKTPNIDRLVKSGITFTRAYSPCPVCVPARNIIRTGKEPYSTGCFDNDGAISNVSSNSEYLAEVMAGRGYRTFGIGKFHTVPDQYEDLGYETHIHTEEIHDTIEGREKDSFYKYLKENHPQFDFVEQLHGERTNMYYVPQMSSFPAEMTVEAFVSREAVKHIKKKDDRPYFGVVSFIGPHPPFAPPIPYNRMYDPDLMPTPVKGNKENDLLDEQLSWMNYLVWAEDINDSAAKNLWSRYYGEITYIDSCIGKVLDAVEQNGEQNNTLICFTSDHGDHMGDHHAWQKESFYEQSTHIPMIISWPEKLSMNSQSDQLVSLTDLFGLATETSGELIERDGVSILSTLSNEKMAREILFGYYGKPGTPRFKMMAIKGKWKYIYMANGSREQLFNLEKDPHELESLIDKNKTVLKELRSIVLQKLKDVGLETCYENNHLRGFPFEKRKEVRIHQFDMSRGIHDFQYSSGNFISSK